ncbi:hypothetical protein Ciccas_012885, partial [Cichlidogyrus casuarinus]
MADSDRVAAIFVAEGIPLEEIANYAILVAKSKKVLTIMPCSEDKFVDDDYQIYQRCEDGKLYYLSGDGDEKIKYRMHNYDGYNHMVVKFEERRQFTYTTDW